MPRQTRAAARAQEVDEEIVIAVDETATEEHHFEAQKREDSERPPLVEMTANVLQDIKVALENQEVKDDAKLIKPKKNGKKNGNGANKAAKKEPRKYKSNLQGEAEAEKSTSPPSEVEQQGEDQNDGEIRLSPNVSEADLSMVSEQKQDIPRPQTSVTHEETIVPNPGEVQSQPSGSDQSSNEPDEHPRGEDSSQTIEAVQRLESLFEKPETQIEEVAINIMEAANTLLPPSPSKKKPTRSSDKGMKSGKKPTPNMSTKAVKSNESVSKPVSKCTDQKQKPRVLSSTPKASESESTFPTATLQDEADNRGKRGKPKQRSEIAALNTPPKVAKSTKPATRPTFTLPSESIQEKLKAQKEERQRRQEQIAAKMAEKKQQKGLSIKPPRKSTEGAKPLSTNSARRSSAFKTSMINQTEKPKPAVIEAKKRASTLVSRTRPSLSTATPLKNATMTKTTAAPIVRQNRAATLRRTGSISATNSTKPRTSLMRAPEKKETVKATASAAPKKEEKPVKEPAPFGKAEAARRARAEAAERGRAASREWAEKKRKEVEAKKAVAQSKEQIEMAEEGKENVAPVGA